MGKFFVDRQALVSELEKLRAQRPFLKMVFTNGCFDILHVGHVRYLREAAKLGDILVVGINTDESVSRLKPGRPVNGEKERAELLASLEMVDYAVLFQEETPYELIKSIRPDVLVKGGDWKKEEIVGSDIVPVTLSLKYENGFSTTETIRKIRSLPA
ncbi:MAG: adenylyltransferase/cytidyltransferase family protein [Nitrospiraceae bacterium]|nr:adenylyltransferase/cytidyltransferase family protein [Nitrospiraceae bacterium]